MRPALPVELPPGGGGRRPVSAQRFRSARRDGTRVGPPTVRAPLDRTELFIPAGHALGDADVAEAIEPGPASAWQPCTDAIERTLRGGAR